MRAPAGLEAGGKALWRSVTETWELDGVQLVMLEHACRLKDHLDRLSDVIDDDTVAYRKVDGVRFVIGRPLELVASTARTLSQTLVALRLPDENGRRPQRRGPRGVYRPRTFGPLAPTSRNSELDAPTGDLPNAQVSKRGQGSSPSRRHPNSPPPVGPDGDNSDIVLELADVIELVDDPENWSTE